MPIRSRQKKPNAEPRQKPNHSHAVVDPMVDPGSPPHRRQARAKADTTRTRHRMVTLAQSSSGGRSASPPQSETATVMLGVPRRLSEFDMPRRTLIFDRTYGWCRERAEYRASIA